MEKKEKPKPSFKRGDLVSFTYDGYNANNVKVKVKRVVCVESPKILEDGEWHEGWYKAHLMYDEQGFYIEHDVYKLEDVLISNITGKQIYKSAIKNLVARIGEE